MVHLVISDGITANVSTALGSAALTGPLVMDLGECTIDGVPFGSGVVAVAASGPVLLSDYSPTCELALMLLVPLVLIHALNLVKP